MRQSVGVGTCGGLCAVLQGHSSTAEMQWGGVGVGWGAAWRDAVWCGTRTHTQSLNRYSLIWQGEEQALRTVHRSPYNYRRDLGGRAGPGMRL